ncbi:MAG TPA: response regulator transcription factor [Oceanospirillales bacterium]|nr:response regulator transcription factor [Oceanospirillales bacterium]
MKYLVVDDEPLAVLRLQKMLENQGINDILTANNGQKAVDIVKKYHPKIIFLDIEMPVMNGMQAAKEIKKVSPESKIIFCTAYDDYAIKAFDLSASDYLLKPVTNERLQQALDKVVDKKSSQTITFQHGLDLLTISINDVYCFTSEDKNTFMHCQYGEVIIDESLLTLEKRFANYLLRINRNALINISELCGIHRTTTANYAKLANTDYQPQISRRNIQTVKELLT